MTPQQVELLEALITSHPKHAAYTKLERISQLERMMSFYIAKADLPENPRKMKLMFNGFVSTLDYAINTIKLYDNLTNGLDVLYKEVKK